ncbi:hypothetical protein [Streptomyces sp. Amel2xC10]|uniref:hypothetical protein n=1 Tax=Streptomyces sp. Amel2xC10 TaxID=1305826 RepID=UPI000A0880F9|nr:hypothetical protein [Streptomyces sp. Amel2xC10]SMF86533.1 hypothetical protein SAMN02745830_07185 [Streptomyces sp. Amel2xC10]
MAKTPPAVALLGHHTQYTGHARSATYRWFTDPVVCERCHPDGHGENSRTAVALLREGE